MSRLVGIVALVIAFSCCGLVMWRISTPRTSRGLPPKPTATANLQAVQSDLCSLARAEVDYQRVTGRYANLHDLRSDGHASLADSRWPYRYVLDFPTGDQFVITAVAEAPIQDQPRVLLIDDQMRVRTKSHPPQVYPCIADSATKSK